MKSGGLRSATHAGMLGFVLLTPVLGKWGMAATAFAAFLLNILVLPRTAFGKSLRREGEGRWNGVVAYPLAVALGYLLFEPVVAAAAWAMMAIGDAMASYMGQLRDWPSRIPWNRSKSAAGCSGFLNGAWIGAMVVLVALQLLGGDVWQETGELAWWIAFVLVAAAAGTIVESFAWPADDNIPVLLATGGTLALLRLLV